MTLCFWSFAYVQPLPPSYKPWLPAAHGSYDVPYMPEFLPEEVTTFCPNHNLSQVMCHIVVTLSL